jgi:subtilisin family serine protease
MKQFRWILGLAVLLISSCGLTFSGNAWEHVPMPGPGEAEPGVLLVKFKAAMTPEEIAQAAKTLGVSTQKTASVLQALRTAHQVANSTSITQINTERWEISKQQSLALAMQTIQQSALVEYVEPNYKRVALAPRADGPNDTFYQAGDQWWLEAISADRAFAEGVLPVGQDVVIAILDSGILLTHEDLQTNLVAGKDFVVFNGTANDDDGHGTHVGGIAGATTNNNLGMAGTAGNANVKLMPIKVLDDVGSGYDSDIAQGIVWAADHGVRVINLSLGSQNMGKVLEEAVDYAYEQGCVIVAAAGNDGDEGNPIIYPAAYNKVIAVGACTVAGERASYSEYHDYIDLVAPGGDDGTNADRMLSTYYLSDDSYAFGYGTSMAAPVVSGVAALLVLQDATRTVEEIRQLLINTADKIGSLQSDSDGWDRYLGWGRVNCYSALTRSITFQGRTTGRASYNYPNPFSPTVGEQTHILIPEAQAGSGAHLRIFDGLGYLVYEKSIPSAQVYTGSIIPWSGHDTNHDWVANGVYPYILEVGSKRFKNKIVVLNK